MTPFEKTLSKKKTNRQKDTEKTHGKKKYRVRRELERDGEKQVKEFHKNG